MQFDVVTLFPSMFVGPFEDGVLARARRSGRVGIRIHDLRRWGRGRHRQVDDVPFGGGGGMVLKPEPLVEAVEWIREAHPAASERVVLLSPQGRRLDRTVASGLVEVERLILLCGRYEGIDERVRDLVVDEELSVGDFVLTGGELPAMMVIDAVSRWIPGVLGQAEAAERDSFSGDLLDFPQFTRPRRYRELDVPEVLTGGDHGAIDRWRRERALEATRSKRPDLLDPDGADSPDGRR
jgi:tRNA (guanine37-N1)-methyltransferase